MLLSVARTQLSAPVPVARPWPDRPLTRWRRQSGREQGLSDERQRARLRESLSVAAGGRLSTQALLEWLLPPTHSSTDDEQPALS